ncbi:MAG: DUF3012 domain-containing protein [Halioglobus sp.]
MKALIAASLIVLLSACSAEPGSERWCAQMKEKSKSDWTADEGLTYGKHCLLDSQTIGSEEWCEDLKEKDRGDWTNEENMGYAKHCVI